MIVTLNAVHNICIFFLTRHFLSALMIKAQISRYNATLKDASQLPHIDTTKIILCLFCVIITWPALVELPLFL